MIKSLGLYFFLSIFASLAHYLFQILAARALGDNGYALFSGEWAQLHLLMGLGTWAQYWSALRHQSKSVFRKMFWIVHLISFLAIISFFIFSDSVSLGVAIVGVSICHALLSGRLLFKADYFRLGMINLLVAAIKILLLFFIPKELLSTSTVFLTLYFSFALSHIVYMFLKSDKSKEVLPSSDPTSLWGALVLTLATHFFPVADLLRADFFPQTKSLTIMAPISLITRAVFFVQIIFAQWWLPRVRISKWQLPTWSFAVSLGVIIIGPLIGIPFMTFIFEHTLVWKTFPSFELLYVASISAGCMALHFQQIQYIVLHGKVTMGTLMLSCIVLSWLISGLMNLAPEDYFIMQALVHSLSVIVSYKGIKTE